MPRIAGVEMPYGVITPWRLRMFSAFMVGMTPKLFTEASQLCGENTIRGVKIRGTDPKIETTQGYETQILRADSRRNSDGLRDISVVAECWWLGRSNVSSSRWVFSWRDYSHAIGHGWVLFLPAKCGT